MTLWHEDLIAPWFYTSVLWNIKTWKHNDFVTQRFCSTMILWQKDFVSCEFHKTIILWHLYFETQWISLTLETAARISAISRPFTFLSFPYLLSTSTTSFIFFSVHCFHYWHLLHWLASFDLSDFLKSLLKATRPQTSLQ